MEKIEITHLDEEDPNSNPNDGVYTIALLLYTGMVLVIGSLFGLAAQEWLPWLSLSC